MAVSPGGAVAAATVSATSLRGNSLTLSGSLRQDGPENARLFRVGFGLFPDAPDHHVDASVERTIATADCGVEQKIEAQQPAGPAHEFAQQADSPRVSAIASPSRDGDGRPRMTGASLKRSISSRSRTFGGAPCRSASALEQRMETLRPAEQGRRFRSLLRRARRDEFIGASHPDVRFDHRARACVGRGGKRGQEGQALGRSRGGFTTKIHAKSDASGDIIAFDLTGGEASTRVTSTFCST